MSSTNIVKLLEKSLQRIRERRELSVLESPQILLQCRRLSEASKLNKRWPQVKLYADWSAHVEITRSERIFEMLLDATKILVRSDEDSGRLTSEINNLLAIRQLQQELIDIFLLHDLDCFLFINDHNLGRFLAPIFESICAVPAGIPDGQKSQKYTQKRHEILKVAGNDPQRAVMRFSITKIEEEETLKFFNKPVGTFAWEIHTAADIIISSVLTY